MLSAAQKFSCLFLAALVIPAAANVSIVNGSFENVAIGAPYSSNPADIPGWTHSGAQGDALIWSALYPQCCGGTNSANAGDGNQFVTMGGGFGPYGSSEWSQTINGLTSGQTYAIDFMIAAEGETNFQNVTVGMTSGSNTAAQTYTTSDSQLIYFWQNWSSRQYLFTANATSATLQFSVTNQQWDVGLDAVSIAEASTPEPAFYGLLAASLSGLAFVRRSAKNKKR